MGQLASVSTREHKKKYTEEVQIFIGSEDRGNKAPDHDLDDDLDHDLDKI